MEKPQSFSDKLRAFNADWNDLPRRLLWIVALIGLLLLALLAFPYVAPFVFSAVLAWLINGPVTFLTTRLGGRRVTRNIVSAVFVLLLTSLLLASLILLLGKVFSEIGTLAAELPGWVSSVSSQLIEWVDGLNIDFGAFDVEIEQTVRQLLTDFTATLTSFATRVASTVARVAVRTASQVPQAILFLVLTIMGTFYMCSDKDRIMTFLHGLLPEKHRQRTSLFRASILRALLGQIRAALIMLCVTFVELSIGFSIMRLDYAILLALLIAVLDALPVIGAGLFLTPMCLYGIVFGNTTLAVGAALMYLTIIIMRQLLEPRIIGQQLGLYPLTTMMAMYAGLRAVGFVGMLLGPALLLISKVALTAHPDGTDATSSSKPLKPLPRLSRRKRRPPKQTGG